MAKTTTDLQMARESRRWQQLEHKTELRRLKLARKKAEHDAASVLAKAIYQADLELADARAEAERAARAAKAAASRAATEKAAAAKASCKLDYARKRAGVDYSQSRRHLALLGGKKLLPSPKIRQLEEQIRAAAKRAKVAAKAGLSQCIDHARTLAEEARAAAAEAKDKATAAKQATVAAAEAKRAAKVVAARAVAKAKADEAKGKIRARQQLERDRRGHHAEKTSKLAARIEGASRGLSRAELDQQAAWDLDHQLGAGFGKLYLEHYRKHFKLKPDHTLAEQFAEFYSENKAEVDARRWGTEPSDEDYQREYLEDPRRRGELPEGEVVGPKRRKARKAKLPKGKPIKIHPKPKGYTGFWDPLAGTPF